MKSIDAKIFQGRINFENSPVTFDVISHLDESMQLSAVRTKSFIKNFVVDRSKKFVLE